MAYNIELADRVRGYLIRHAQLKIDEKEIFSGLTFMVDDKMCVSVSGENLMCRFDPKLYEEVAEKPGFEPMLMKGKELNGYCYVNPHGFQSQKEFEYWVNLCLDYNGRAKSSKKNKK